MSLNSQTYSEVVLIIKEELETQMKESGHKVFPEDSHCAAIHIIEKLREKDFLK